MTSCRHQKYRISSGETSIFVTIFRKIKDVSYNYYSQLISILSKKNVTIISLYKSCFDHTTPRSFLLNFCNDMHHFIYIYILAL